MRVCVHVRRQRRRYADNRFSVTPSVPFSVNARNCMGTQACAILMTFFISNT